MDKKSVLERYVALGFHPVHAEILNDDDPSDGKRPRKNGWQNRSKEKSIELAQIAIASAPDNTNLGLVTGEKSGVWVLDVDPPKPADLEKGILAGVRLYEEMLAIYNENGPIETLTVRTGSGGLHVYFKYDEWAQNLHSTAKMDILTPKELHPDGFPPGKYTLDVRAKGGFLVGFGSRHVKTGNMYEIVEDCEIEVAPQWLKDIIDASSARNGFSLKKALKEQQIANVRERELRHEEKIASIVSGYSRKDNNLDVPKLAMALNNPSSLQRRLYNFEDWRRVIFVLKKAAIDAGDPEKYRALAHEVSALVPEKYEQKTTDSVYDVAEPVHSIGCLVNWLKEDLDSEAFASLGFANSAGKKWLYFDYHKFHDKELTDELFNEIMEYFRETTAVIDRGTSYFLVKLFSDVCPDYPTWEVKRNKYNVPEGFSGVHLWSRDGDSEEVKKVTLAALFSKVAPRYLTYADYVFLPYSPCPPGHRDYDRHQRKQIRYPFKIVNRFQGFPAAELGRDYDIADLEPVFEHMRIMSGRNEAYFNYFIKWCASVIQRPYDKVRTSLIFYSEKQQTGKSIFFESFFSQIIGQQHFFSTNDISKVIDKFNAILFGKLMAVLDEATDWEGRSAENCKLKNKISQMRTVIERKGIDAQDGLEYTNYVILTNKRKSVRLESGDTRFAPVEMGCEKRNDAAYFDRLGEAFDDRDIQRQFFWYLVNVDLTGFKANSDEQIPDTPLRRYMKMGSRSIYDEFWVQYFESKSHVAMEDTLKIPKTKLYELWKSFLDGEDSKIKPARQAFYREMIGRYGAEEIREKNVRMFRFVTEKVRIGGESQ